MKKNNPFYEEETKLIKSKISDEYWNISINSLYQPKQWEAVKKYSIFSSYSSQFPPEYIPWTSDQEELRKISKPKPQFRIQSYAVKSNKKEWQDWDSYLHFCF